MVIKGKRDKNNEEEKTSRIELLFHSPVARERRNTENKKRKKEEKKRKNKTNVTFVTYAPVKIETGGCDDSNIFQ